MTENRGLAHLELAKPGRDAYRDAVLKQRMD